MQQKEIAAEVGVTHGQVRIWSTEEDFKSKKQEYRAEMEEYIVNLVKTKVDQFSAEVQEYVSLDLEDMAGKGLPTVAFPELQDSTQYNKELVEQIVNRLTGIAEELDMEHVQYVLVIYSLLANCFASYISPEEWEDLKSYVYINIHGLIGAAYKKKSPKRELRLINYYIEILESMDTTERGVVKR